MSLPSTFDVPTPAQTASLAASYIPPFATITLAADNSSPSPTSPPTPYPTTPVIQDDRRWIATYLGIHKLSSPSYRYMYIFWFIVIVVFLGFSVLHLFGTRGGAVGALFSKFSLRRRTFRKKRNLAGPQRPNKPHKQPLPLPSNAQLLTISTLYILALILCFLGPDYIAPGTHIFDLTHNLTSRDLSNLYPRDAPVPQTRSLVYHPSYTISKAWWTTGGRTGTIAFALFPLCVLFALKAPPFAVFALPFLVQLYNDKLALIHKWCGRLIWFITALHVAFWSIQLGLEKRGPDNPTSAFNYAFLYPNFVYAWTAFIFLTLLIALSLRPVRNEFYEIFYFFHVLLIPLTLIFSALHFPPIGFWCWSTLALWGAERLWRFLKFMHINGILGGISTRRNFNYATELNKIPEGFARPNAKGELEEPANSGRASRASYISYMTDNTEHGFISKEEMSDHSRSHSSGQETIQSYHSGSTAELLAPSGEPKPSEHLDNDPSMPGHIQLPFQVVRSRRTYIPPPGYAHAVLLPGRTIRLTISTAHRLTWAPGQHVLLTVPSVSKFTSHPFTIASICDKESQSYEERELLIIIRARAGFTKELWSHIERLQDSGQVGDTPTLRFLPPSRGVLLRAYVGGPFGSSIRARWTSYSTVLVVAGGSGVSFAVSVLEYVCMCMAGRSGKSLGAQTGFTSGSRINRVRFVWIVREFSHIQWVASALRRCMDMVPSPALQIDIFVTSDSAKNPAPEGKKYSKDNEPFLPPNPDFHRVTQHNLNASEVSLASVVSTNSEEPRLRAIGATNIVKLHGELGHEEHALDMTNFDGEDDSALPGEDQFSNRLRKEGKIRRAKTRMSMARSRTMPTVGQSAGLQTNATSQAPYGSGEPDKLSALEELTESPKSTDHFHTSLLDTPYGGAPSHTGHNMPVRADAGGKLQAFPPTQPHQSEVTKQDVHEMMKTEFPMDEAEAEDMAIVSERARPGRAKMDKIVAEESWHCRDSMIVGCCGPLSLNAVVRKTVAARIDPSRIWHGDPRGNIALVSEDFEW